MSTKLSASEQKKEDWMNSKWRPLMGYMYMLVCITDFIVFPVLWSMVQAIHGGQVSSQWQPITLQGAGLFHMAMGAIIGVAAFGRTQEKLANANQAPSTPSFTPSFSKPTAPSFTPAPAPAFDNTASTAPTFNSAPAFGAKPMGPGRAEQPEL